MVEVTTRVYYMAILPYISVLHLFFCLVLMGIIACFVCAFV